MPSHLQGCGNCLYPGTCIGEPVNIIFDNTVCDCKRSCENFPTCNFWTYDEATEVCTMNADCDGGIGDTCATCTYGPKQCAVSHSVWGP